MNLKEKAKQLKSRTYAVFLALKRKETPLHAKILAALTVGYALSPIDLIPDFIPVLGYLDDIVILPGLIYLCIRLIPKEIMQACQEEADQKMREGFATHWYYALPIVLIWLILIALLIKPLIHLFQ